MHLTAIGPYQIRRELGRGGMGEVYLALDTRLDRQVAIKALPAHLAQDAERLSRFQREARVLASLNHPGIGAIYGLEHAEGRQYLILEYVEGETLADRLVNGPIPADEALNIARQIAEALEAAHEKGVVHRDLKPANVMLTGDSVVKVLDFGLARTADASPSSTSVPTVGTPESPTMPVHSPTIPGAIMGTAGYMSPEQARGKAVDKRSDIFSFGCVFYEMLTGSGPFPGETATDSIGAILHREPDWALLPARTPARVRELLRSCLAKDRRNRLHDIGDARLEIERAIAGHDWSAGASPAAPVRRNWTLPAGLAVAAAVLAGVAGWLLAGGLAGARSGPAPAPPARTYHVSSVVQDKPRFDRLVAIDPESRFLIYTAWPELPPESISPEGVLVVRRLDRDETSIIEGTEGAREGALSPDGRSIAFSAARDRAGTKLTLRRIGLDNGRPSGKPETICELTSAAPLILCWASDRELVFSPSWEGIISIVSASGGEPREVLREDRPSGIESWAEFTPLIPGKSILATRWSVVGQRIRVSTEAIELASGKRTPVLPEAAAAQYIPDAQGSGGYLVATRNTQTTLIAVRFDAAEMHPIGEPVTVWSGNPINGFRVASGGTLAISTRPSEVLDRRLAWIDDKGQAQPIPGMMRSFGEVVVSPDGERVLSTIDATDNAELVSECWVQDLARRTATRLSTQGAMIGMAWSRDGQRIAHGLAKEGGFSVWQRPSDGSGEPVQIHTSPDSRTLLVPLAWSPDGRALAVLHVDLTTDNTDVYMLRQAPGSAAWDARAYLKSPAREDVSGFSPDSKWVLVGSSQSGRGELYVQPFTGDGEADARAGRRQISSGGGGIAWWSQDGQEIRYLDPERRVMSVPVKTEPTFSAGEPTVLYSIKDLKTRSVTFAPDGRLLVVLSGESERTTRSVGIVINFIDELRAKLGGAN